MGMAGGPAAVLEPPVSFRNMFSKVKKADDLRRGKAASLAAAIYCFVTSLDDI
jgi:hypothetical protein